MKSLLVVTPRRAALFAYWITFTILMARAATNPGFVSDRQLRPYPWRTVLLLAAAFALVTLWLARWWNLRFQRRASRIGEAILFVGSMLFCVLPALSTDLAGYVYGAAWFAFATGVVLLGRLVVNHASRIT